MPSPGPIDLLQRMKESISTVGVPSPLLKSRKAFPVLVSTIISLRTRDAVTERVSHQVLNRAPDVDSMISIKTEKLEELLKPAGFYRQKAGQLKRIASILKNDFQGRVPDDMDLLLTLPGVGRKTANFVMGMVFGVPSICVDVHVHRISNRLGLVNTRTPEETEFSLQKVFPREKWTGINHIMVRFGQNICRPVRPLCEKCPLKDKCPSAGAAKG
jgi:endonuclease III